MENKADLRFKAQLDDNRYNESELISIKISAHRMSYYSNSKEFERVDGQVEIGGIQYNFVKRRVYQDSIELRCIPNHTAMQFRTVKNEFFKLLNGLQHPGQEKKDNTHSVKDFSTDYYTVSDALKIDDPFMSILKASGYYKATLPLATHTTAEQPPEAMA